MKLAILIIGVQNSGKTSTIKHLISLYNGKSLKIMKAGWNDIYLNSVFKSLRLHFYCVPASPTETNFKLSSRLSSFLPEFLIISEQLGGHNYFDTTEFLTTNGYSILTYTLTNSMGYLDWDRFDASTRTIKLDNRANEIISDIKDFIRVHGII